MSAQNDQILMGNWKTGLTSWDTRSESLVQRSKPELGLGYTESIGEFICSSLDNGIVCLGNANKHLESELACINLD